MKQRDRRGLFRISGRKAQAKQADQHPVGHGAGKPRLAVVIQDDRFDAADSVVVCPVTSDPTDAPALRIPVAPDEEGLHQSCRLMVDKVAAVPRARLRRRVGMPGADEMTDLNRAIVVFLGLGG